MSPAHGQRPALDSPAMDGWDLRVQQTGGVSVTQRFWLVLGAVLLATVVTLALLGDRLGPQSGSSTPGGPAPGSPLRAGSGVGDPYLPNAGGAGYDVQHYDVRLSAAPNESMLSGSATVTAVATQDLDEFHLDLFLAASAVSVNNTRASYTQRADDLAITAPRGDPGRPAISAGQTFTVVIEYAGDPSRVDLPGTRAYYRAGQEFLIAGEPEGAALWYPVNDHPRDAATMRFSVTVPRGVEAISAGRLVAQDADPDRPDADRWVWAVDRPTVSYASFLAVGQYRIEQGTTDGRPYVYAVSRRLGAEEQTDALRWLRRTPEAIAKLERILGPYPFNGMGGFVPSMDIHWAGLETAMRPVYHFGAAGSEELLNHELAHMWLGDTATLFEWNDLFINESLTSYAEWLTTAGSNPARNFDRIYRGQAEKARFWGPPLADPGLKELFVRVYDRGPAAVHALRTRMGDAAFFSFLRAWAGRPGPRSLEDFRREADAATPEDLTGFFAEWLDQTDRPTPTVANGVPR